MSQSFEDVQTLLRTHRFRYTSEMELQDGIERLLSGNAFAFEREAQLSALHRPDFLVAGGIVIEVKVARRASRPDVTRQLSLYAQSARVNEIVLVTDRRQLAIQPRSLSGKPLVVVSLTSGLT